MNAQLAAVPADKNPTARGYLQQAQAKLKDATDKKQQIHDQRQKLLDFALKPSAISTELEAARAEHTVALRAWAEAGAAGDSPAPPASIARLEAKLAIAQREADAADTAAHALDPSLAAAQQAANTALTELRHRRERVLYEIASPMIDEFYATTFRANSLREHLTGLGMVGRDLIDENPGLSKVFMAINDAIRVFPVLEPGGAEVSRQAWRDLIAALAGDPNAKLAEAPASGHSPMYNRKSFLPDHLGDEA